MVFVGVVVHYKIDKYLGPHFNPFGKSHESPNSDERHVGSLGNITSDGSVATFHIEDSLVQVMGPFSVIGRSVIIYENEDDLGHVWEQYEYHVGFESREQHKWECREGYCWGSDWNRGFLILLYFGNYMWIWDV